MAKRRTKKKTRLQQAMRQVHEIRRRYSDGKEFTEMDPECYEAVGVVLGIMRGEISGRHVMSRLNAAVQILDRFVGKPVSRHEVDVTDDLASMLTASMAKESEYRATLAPRPALPPSSQEMRTSQVQDAEIVEDVTASGN